MYQLASAILTPRRGGRGVEVTSLNYSVCVYSFVRYSVVVNSLHYFFIYVRIEIVFKDFFSASQYTRQNESKQLVTMTFNSTDGPNTRSVKGLKVLKRWY